MKNALARIVKNACGVMKKPPAVAPEECAIAHNDEAAIAHHDEQHKCRIKQDCKACFLLSLWHERDILARGKNGNCFTIFES
ncbi:MAG: hypothetical protein IKL98_06430 [Akkermansia sp.]|nr:hypothetical protein [Akkermansia sp.]